MLRFAWGLFLVGWFSLLVAAAVQSHRPADWSSLRGLEPEGRQSAAPALVDRMEQTTWRRNAAMEVSEEEVNRYLAATIQGRQTGITASAVRFSRVALDFEPGVATLCLGWGEGGHVSATASLVFTMARRGGDFVIEVQQGAFGRLPVPRGVMCTLIPSLGGLTKCLQPEMRVLFQMNQIRFEKDKVVLDPRSETVK